MKWVDKVITNTVRIYTAIDGEEFSDKTKCLKHEWDLLANKVYMVYRRGQRIDSSEIYSSMELAKKAQDGNDSFYIKEICLDERFWSSN